MKNSTSFRQVASVDATHLTGNTGGQLCGLVAYDANLNIMPMCFGLFRTETKDNWSRFMSRVSRLYPHFTTIISDRAKGLECLDDMFLAHEVFHGLCGWHVLEKNGPKQDFHLSRYVTTT
jgi:hypothetical protein